MSSSNAHDNATSNGAVTSMYKFIQEDPNREYTVDANAQQVCRQLPNGNQSCIRVALDQKAMFEVMQKLDFFCTLPIDPEKTYLECKRANTFTILSKPVEAPTDLSDGIVLFEICANVDPKRFKLLQTADIGDNWVLKVNNLKKLHKMITHYYDDVLNQPIHKLDPVHLNLIAREGDTKELLKLCQLVLFLAVQSENNHQYVSQIQTLGPKAQHAIMILIETMQSQLVDSPHAVDGEGDEARINEQRLLTLEAELARLFSEKQSMEKTIGSLTQANTDLQTHAEELVATNKDTTAKLRDMERLLAQADQSGKADFLLRTEIDQLKQELEKAETRCHAAEMLAEEQTTIIADMNRRLEDGVKASAEATRLRDQLREYKHAAEKLQKTEHVLEKYKKKLEESGDLRRQIKVLEDQNQQLVGRNQSIEEEYRKVSQFKPLMDTYKEQLAALESKNNLLTLQHTEYEHEMRQLKDKLTLAESERQQGQEQLSILEDNLRELELNGGPTLESPTTPLKGNSLDNALADGTVVELKAKVARLEGELFTARKAQPDTGLADKVLLLENLLDDAKQSKAKLEQDYVHSHQRNLELESTIAQLRNDASSASTSDDGDHLVKENQKLRQQLQQREIHVQRLKAALTQHVEYKQQQQQHLPPSPQLSVTHSQTGSDYKEAIDSLQTSLASRTQEVDQLKQELHHTRSSCRRELDQMKRAVAQFGTWMMHNAHHPTHQPPKGPRTPHAPMSWMGQQRQGLNIKLQRP
ncbi:hypothetical protein H4R34_002655 [Dimargaris verticillata]|uniref:HOOK N-terminal domain-containing protein n=1 Tax=Dimargaris verticillata TaxID=2761393 RepID=A0A9W8ECQ4_9FUNG|nr:hypothetical protein H4R34_002655 [Dimargaris verticillata]